MRKADRAVTRPSGARETDSCRFMGISRIRARTLFPYGRIFSVRYSNPVMHSQLARQPAFIRATVFQFPCRKLPALRTFPIHDQICIYHAVIDPVSCGEGDLDAVQPVTFTMQGLGQKLPLLQGLCCIAALRRFDCFCPIVIKVYKS